MPEARPRTAPAIKRLLSAIESRSAVVGVIGLGYVGLPLIRAFCAGGLKTVGFDVDPEKIRKLRAGQSYIRHFPAQLVRDLVRSGQFTPTDDFSRISACDALIICVPTPLTIHREPDMHYVAGTASTISQHLRAGQLVVLESTTYPGTTREVVLPALEKSGRSVGRDFLLAYSPEREDPGRSDFQTADIPKVVGGYDAPSLQAATALYQHAVKTVVPVESCETAEAAKILENCYRCINIAMINELKMIFDRMGVDVWKVIAAAKTKPFGFQAFYPGPGLGGHCIPIDPFYLSWKAKEFDFRTRFIELAGEINLGMPYFVVENVVEALSQKGKPLRGSRILILGVAYKRDIDDLRESPSLTIIELLRKRGASVEYNDPYIPYVGQGRKYTLNMASTPIEKVSEFDCVVIATDHSQYDFDAITSQAQLVVDTRNATRSIQAPHIIKC